MTENTSIKRATLPQTLHLIRGDYRIYAKYFNKRPSLVSLVSMSLHPGLISLFIHRWSHYFHGLNLKFISRVLYLVNITITGADIGPGTIIGKGCVLLHSAGLTLSGRIGDYVLITQGVGLGGDGAWDDIGGGPGLPVIEDDVILGGRCVILGPKRIGKGSFVCSMSFVISDVAPGATVFGNPARPIKVAKEHTLKRPRRLDEDPGTPTPGPLAAGLTQAAG
jgi:serine O-acetyltransferase